MDINNIVLGKQIKKARVERQLTQSELAKRVSITSNYLSMLERGTHYPKLETLLRIADALDVSVSHLLMEATPHIKANRIELLAPSLIELTDEQFDLVRKLVNVVSDGFTKQNLSN